MSNVNSWKIIEHPAKRSISGFYEIHFYGNTKWALEFCTEKFGPPGRNAKFYRWTCSWSYNGMRDEYSYAFFHFRHKKDIEIFTEQLSKFCLLTLLKEDYGF